APPKTEFSRILGHAIVAILTRQHNIPTQHTAQASKPPHPHQATHRCHITTQSNIYEDKINI
ncbi:MULTISPECIES: hypothetical protein, partial [Bacillus]